MLSFWGLQCFVPHSLGGTNACFQAPIELKQPLEAVNRIFRAAVNSARFYARIWDIWGENSRGVAPLGAETAPESYKMLAKPQLGVLRPQNAENRGWGRSVACDGCQLDREKDGASVGQ